MEKKRNGYNGAIKYDKIEKKWILQRKCNEKITHDTCKFDRFYNDYINNNINKYDLSIIKFQKYFVRSLYKANNADDINKIQSIFKTRFNTSLKLKKEEIYKEKNYAFGTSRNLDMDKLCVKIANEEINVNIKTIDIFYDYKNKSNKIEYREEKVIILTTKLMEKFIKNDEV